MLSAYGVPHCHCVADGALFTMLDAGFMPRAIFCDQRLRSGENGFEALLTRCPAAPAASIRNTVPTHDR